MVESNLVTGILPHDLEAVYAQAVSKDSLVDLIPCPEKVDAIDKNLSTKTSSMPRFPFLAALQAMMGITRRQKRV